MIRKALFLMAIAAALVGSLFFFGKTSPKKDQELKPNNWFFNQRAYPYGEIDHLTYKEEVKKAIQDKKDNSISLNKSGWEFAGPVNIGGRITDVEMHASDINTIYAGTAYGGIFKSTDAGNSWNPIFDEALSLSIGDLCIAPSNPNIIYVGTGEANAGGGSLAYDGLGIFKSVDEGNTWEHKGLEEGRNTGKVVVHPTDPDIAYVAVMGELFGENEERGIFKTTDGGNTWEQALYLNDSTGGIDVVIHPENPDTVYAAMWERVRRPNRRSYGGESCGIYRSYDGGENWTELTNGLYTPASNTGRIGLTISHSNPNILYAIYADKTGYFSGIYKTNNNGDSWSRTNDSYLNDMYSSYGWWFSKIHVDPTNPDIVYAMGLDIYQTTNGGNSWSNISSYNVHVDQHGIYAHPLNNNFVVSGNDGGINISTNQGSSWTHVKTLPITQFYTCEVDHMQPQRLYGGTQDNGTIRTMTGNFNDWQEIYGGDGFRVLVDPTDNNYVYAEYQYGNFARSTDGGSYFSYAMSGISSGDRFNWNTPYIIDPVDPSTMYFGTQKLYKSTDRASSWAPISPDLTNGGGNGNITFGTITCIDASAINSNIIICGTDDGNISITNNGGTDWTNISGTLPNRWITSVKTCPHNENSIYATISGYRFNESLSHIYKSNNLGSDWEDISSNLPNVPVNEIIIDPDSTGNLYTATDVGVYYSNNDGDIWHFLDQSMPNLPIIDIKLHNSNEKFLIAATFGRGIYKYNLSSGISNLPPAIETTHLDTAYINLEYSFIVQASDPENDELNYSAEGLPIGFSMNSITGEISGTATQEGIYNITITVTDSHEASDVLSTNLIVKKDEGIPLISQKQTVRIYPNPCKDFVTIQGKMNNKIYYQIYAVNGKIVKEGNIKSGATINISELQKGTYYLKANTDRMPQVTKLVKLQ